MKTIYRKELERRFEEAISKKFEGAKRIRVPKSDQRASRVSAGERIFELCREGDLTCFVCARPNTGGEEFFLDVGWSDVGRFNPAKPPKLISDDRSEFNLHECFIGLSNIRFEGGRKARQEYQIWSCSVPFDDPNFYTIFAREYSLPVTQEDAAKAVSMAVESAILDIENFAVPYFEELRNFKRLNGRATI